MEAVIRTEDDLHDALSRIPSVEDLDALAGAMQNVIRVAEKFEEELRYVHYVLTPDGAEAVIDGGTFDQWEVKDKVLEYVREHNDPICLHRAIRELVEIGLENVNLDGRPWAKR